MIDNWNFYRYFPILFVGHPSYSSSELVISRNKLQKNKQERLPDNG